MNRISLQAAYVLHRRPYRETSALVEVFSKDHGRISLIARGVQKPRSFMQGLLQPFIPLLISWVGQGDLPILSQLETQKAISPLQGECLFAGFYLNELLVRLLQKWDPHPALYVQYETTIAALQTPPLNEKILRIFEKKLLEELGYGLPRSFSKQHDYQFIPGAGLVKVEAGAERGKAFFSGKSLLSFIEEDWQDHSSLQEAKRLMRLMLTELLGPRPIYSRQLFIKEK
jgi:DNA repair protein RecO (recombination protein O)